MATYRFYYDVSRKDPAAITPKTQKDLSQEIEAISDEEAVEKARDLIKTFQENPPDLSYKYEYKLTRVFKEVWKRSI